MSQIYCVHCGEEIHPMRLEVLPNTKTCVKCSQEPKKAGRLVTRGQGEDVETDLEILDQEVYRKMVSLENDFDYDTYYSSSLSSDEEE